jgi:hypothetical protein
MTSNPLEKWIDLFGRMKIVPPDSSPNPMSTQELLECERALGCPLPQAYREYCQVFGSGEFGPYQFRIRGQDSDSIKSWLFANNQLNDGTSLVIEAYRRYSDAPSPEVEQILNAGLHFGESIDQNCVLFFFDLSSYQEVDQSCNIYCYYEHDCVEIYDLGRDFFTFICDFCIGDRAEREFPKMITRLEDLDEETRELYLEDIQDDEMYQSHVFYPY